MNRFSKLHPVVHLFFYLFSLIFILSVSNPFFSLVALISAFMYNAAINRGTAFKRLRFVIAVVAFVSLFNMLFAHYGEDVLFKIKDTEFTLEALFYGINQGIVLSSVVLWFSALSYNSDSERVLYLLRFAPKAALMFSMILGFIPRFNKKLSEIRDAQIALNGGAKQESIKSKIEGAISNLSALITYSLESSIITADSMNARGYNPKAVSASRYKITLQDTALLFIIISLFTYVFYSKMSGEITFIFEPRIYSKTFSFTALICFAVLELIPVFVEMWEEMLWKLSNVKA